MAIFNQIRVINPSMFVESTWLDDIVTARIPILVLRGFLTAEVSDAVVADLTQCRKQVRVSHYPNGALTTLGPYLAKYTSAPENYFTEMRDIQPLLPDTLLTLREQVYWWVQKVLKLESLQTAQEPELGPYSAAIVRFHADGVANPLHNDHIVRDAAGSGLAVTQILHQLSCVVCLQECDDGGELRVYNKKWQADDEQFKTPGELGYQDGVVHQCETCEFSPRRGDIYLFNPTYYHEIDRVSGDTRITMGFFFGLTDKKMKHAIAWS
ncbi:2OG-Fe(II)-dependent halogenase WelO5 family protein [Erwinia sp. V71]|uniref:2OG-Fe(II)-dependent halogenase WelO5 family protein n=1 Tax=Erwinia sp. V71 TaxID=3369424 RepID=UPI003F642E80